MGAGRQGACVAAVATEGNRRASRIWKGVTTIGHYRAGPFLLRGRPVLILPVHIMS